MAIWAQDVDFRFNRQIPVIVLIDAKVEENGVYNWTLIIVIRIVSLETHVNVLAHDA